MVQYFSQAGLQKLKEELKNRKDQLRAEIARKIQDAKALGDLSENAEYQEALTMQSFNEGRIEEVEEILKTAVIMQDEPAGHKHLLVEVGSTVKTESKNGTQEFTIVGSAESDPLKGFISNESPLGKAFLGRAKGEEVQVQIPKGKISYKILDIL